MRGQFGYMLYEVNKLKREGKLPADYNPFPPKFLAVMLGVSLAIVGLIYAASVMLG